jgi:hypothetical protein
MIGLIEENYEMFGIEAYVMGVCPYGGCVWVMFSYLYGD